MNHLMLEESSSIAVAMSAEEWDRIVTAMRLTPQQARVVLLILRGLRDKQIAGELNLSVSTVRTHLRQLFKANYISDRVELVLKVVAIRDQLQADTTAVNGNGQLGRGQKLKCIRKNDLPRNKRSNDA